MKIRFTAFFIATAIAGATAVADKIEINKFRYSGPHLLTTPVMVDSIDVNSKIFDIKSLLSTPLSLNIVKSSESKSLATLPVCSQPALHLLNFRVDNSHYFNGELNVEGITEKEIYLDGKKMSGKKLILTPASHDITIKCLTTGETEDPVKVSITGDKTSLLKINEEGLRSFTLQDVMTGKRFSSVGLSPSGKYLLTSYNYTHDGGRNTFSCKISDFVTGKQIATYSTPMHWMPKSDLLYFTRKVDDKNQLLSLNPASGSESLLAEDVPASFFIMSPSEDFLIYTKYTQGPKEKNPDTYEIIHPEDRQPGWRNRGSLMKYDLATGLSTPLTFGNRNVSLAGISDDGTKILYAVNETRIEQRPSALTSLYLLDLTTNKSTPIFEKEGFINRAILSPDGKSVAVSMSPEGLGGIGRNLSEDKTPSMYDNQLAVIDIATGKVKPLTKEFNPSVKAFQWNHNDGMIYFLAEHRDYQPLYRVNPANGKIEDLKIPEEYNMAFTMSSNSPVLACYGQGASNSDRLYGVNTKKLSHNLLEDLHAERYKDTKIGECIPWQFKTTRGDSIYGRYILPADFDPSKKYPMIVNYYGGCNPTNRTFEGRYPHHLYAANGYVVLVIIPGGAAGFGQEHASRHVNTAGEGIAEDIIEGVKLFTSQNPWVDTKKIGCIGASYGGFMTQYLQTKTDLFAAAISHAGISDHTSYWGEGYWGYSYSEVSMANSYPWSHQDLYVKQSPLYNADKINTPILFLHGDSDTNVPFGESIQMYTALKRLGRPTAFVAVKGANHQVTEFNKRKQWQDTIFAWFAKHLQDDPSWWEEMYPEKPLI